jgi:hypothetical protein
MPSFTGDNCLGAFRQDLSSMWQSKDEASRLCETSTEQRADREESLLWQEKGASVPELWAQNH